MLPVLKSAADGEVRISDVIDQLAVDLKLSEDERSKLQPTGRQTVFSSRVHWARTYLSQAGLVRNTRRAHFAITERGRGVLSQNPGRIDKEYLRRFPEFIEFLGRRRPIDAEHEQPELPPTVLSGDETPDEVVRSAASELDQALRKELLDRVLAASPAFFEQLVVSLLIAMGYGGSLEDAGRKLGKSGDGGVDGVIDQDSLGLDSVYVQAKRYAPNNPVGAGIVREFFGSLDRFRATKGLIITTSSFTRDAIATVNQLSKRMVLIDGHLEK